MATSPQYYASAQTKSVTISVANLNRDGTGALGTLYAAGLNGSRVDALLIEAGATTTANTIRLFLQDASAVKRLLKEINIPAQTAVVGTLTVYEVALDFAPTGIPIPTNCSLLVSTNNAETYYVHAIGGDF